MTLRDAIAEILFRNTSRCLDDGEDFNQVLESLVEGLHHYEKGMVACRLILSIEANPEQNPAETVKLAPKTREQLVRAVREAGYPLPRCFRAG